MPDNRTLAQKALDEAKQIGKGILGASAALNEPMGDGIPNNPIAGFKKAYSKEEKKQAEERQKNKAHGGKHNKTKSPGGSMKDVRYTHGGIMQHD